MKRLVSLVVILVLVAATCNAYKGTALAVSQSEGAIPQSGDLCGGTGGNGEIISVRNNSFTLKLNAGGQKGGGNLTVSLTDGATIEAPTGSISVSDLKKGDRVTLVGDNHRDGTFTAETVVVCGAIGIQKNGTAQTTPIIVRNENPEAFEKVNSVIKTATLFVVGAVWLGMVTFLRLKKKKSLVYILFFTIFYVYCYKVLDYTLLQFQSLLLLKHFVPDLMLNGLRAGKSVNLIPLVTLKLEDVKTSLLNILLMMPFGFGLPFVSNFRMKKVVIVGLLLSIAIEFLQFITGLLANMTFRVADINDVIFNTIGVAIGYVLFVGFVRTYRHIFRTSKILASPILQYVAERPQIDK